MSMQKERPPIPSGVFTVAANGKEIDTAIRVITGLKSRWKIRADGLEVGPPTGDLDQYAQMIVQCVAYNGRDQMDWRLSQVITKAQYDYLDSVVHPPRPKAEPVKVGDVSIFTPAQVTSLLVAKEKQMANETIRVKVVAGTLVLVPKGERGWLFECSAWEGSTIKYGNRVYTYTGGALVEQTEEVRGE